MTTRGVKFSFYPSECVLCFEPDPTKARVLYEAKILDTTVYRDEEGKKKPGYHIHFLRWNNSWDRIVGEQLVLKNTEENKSLMKRLADIARKSSKNKNRRKRIKEILIDFFDGNLPFDEVELEEGATTDTNDTDESAAETDSIGSDGRVDEVRRSLRGQPAFEVDLPESLKDVLDKDYFAVNQDKKLVRLPAEVNVVTVLESFVKTFMMDFWSPNYDRSSLCHTSPKIAIERILPMCQEFVDGLRISFDFILPLLLLYDLETEQYSKLMNTYKHRSPAKQKVPPADSPLLRSPRSRTSDQSYVQSEEPKLPKLSPNVAEEEDEEVTFNPSLKATPVRVTRSRTTGVARKLETESPEKTAKSKEPSEVKPGDVKPDKSELIRQIRKRRSSDRQDDGLKRRKLRSYRKSSEDSSESDQSKPETVMSEPLKAAVKSEKAEKSERPPPLLIPCNVSVLRTDGQSNKGAEKGASGSTDSKGDNGREEILANILKWQLLPSEALSKLPTPPCMLYGSQHLLRLFVKLPSLLSQMDMDEDRQGVLKKLLKLFVQYLSEHVTDLFPDSAYVKESDL